MINLHPSTHRVFATAVAFIVLTFAFVALRIFVRLQARQLSYPSDGLCFVSFLLFCAYAGVMLHSRSLTSQGVTTLWILTELFVDVFDIAGTDPFLPTTPEKLVQFLKILYVEQVLFTFDISIVKLSILAFYWSLFGVEKKMRIGILSITTGCVLWWIIFTFLAAFRCRPPTNAWLPSAPPGSCMPAPDIFLPLESTNLVLDILVLCVPVFTIGQLHLSMKKKLSVIGIFLVGVSVCVASIARIVEITHNNHAEMFFWSCIQLGLAIVCSCLPLLGTVLRRKKLDSYPRSGEYNSFRSRTGGTSGFKITDNSSRAADGPWADSSELQVKNRTEVSGGDKGTDSDYRLEPLPSGNILVQKDVSVI